MLNEPNPSDVSDADLRYTHDMNTVTITPTPQEFSLSQPSTKRKKFLSLLQIKEWQQN